MTKILPTVGHLIGDDSICDLESFDELKDEPICAVVNDSRNVEEMAGEGSILFFSWAGKNFDGHDFIGDVFLKNPKAIVVSMRNLKETYARSIRVRDINIAMAAAAKNFHGNPDVRLGIIGITGTNGKTTTAYLCHAMLSKISKTAIFGTIRHDAGADIKTFPNTTPGALPLFQMIGEAVKNGCKDLVMEISSHAIEDRRVYGLDTDVATFTNLSPEHLDFHGNLENYFLAKRKFFGGENGHCPKYSIVNADDPFGQRLFKWLKLSGKNVFSFGFSKDVDFKISRLSKNDMGGTTFEIDACGRLYPCSSHLFGRYNLLNIAAAFASCLMLHGAADKFVDALAEFHHVPGRLDRVDLANGATAFIDYAHTPHALESVIGELNAVKKGRLITVFGCGGDRDATKRAPMAKIANELSDFAIATEDNPRSEPQENIFEDMEKGVVDSKNFAFISDRKEAIIRAIGSSKVGDIILIAGKGHETYQLKNGKTLPFDDKAIVEGFEFFRGAINDRP
jgi:UDP-N-acetylmuramoyl-L-alanyl-D-glutamate--2,6-diaminopimelate ligase